jgi:hypothetical protein
MLEKFMSNGAGDYRQRYEGTYGFFTTDSGKKLLVRLTHIHADGAPPHVDFVDADGVGFRLNADNDRGFEFIPPKSAWYNTPAGAMFVQRTAQRQWTRGVHPRNTVINLLVKGRMDPQQINFPVLSEIYTPTNSITLLQAKETGRSFALSQQIAMDFASKGLVVLNEGVGTFTMEGNAYHVILHDKELWATEITDVFRRNQLQVTVA